VRYLATLRYRTDSLTDANVEFKDEVDLVENESPSKASSISSVVGSKTKLPVGGEKKDKILHFEHNDPDDPYTWKTWKKITILGIVILTVFNSTLGSGLAANIGPDLSKDWNITDEKLLILPTSIYLVGYIVGPLLWGPLSEQIGRRWVMLGAFTVFTIFTMASALAPNYTALVIFRLICGLMAACAITVCGGTCADLFKSPKTRGRAFASFMALTCFGPTGGPIVSGYLTPISWRWSFWVGLILAGATWVPLALCPETYGPVILQKRAARLRAETGDQRIKAPMDLEPSSVREIATVVLTRPLRMLVFEPIVSAVCLYLSVAYAIFFMFFESFPIIYEGIYGFSAGEEGLTFLPIGIGAIFACGIYLTWDAVISKAELQNKEWVRKEEYRRVPLSAIGGPMLVISCFWVGWTARSSVHWIVPILSGLPFGIGFLLLFMGLINYLVDSYKIYAASAVAAAGTCRSIWGAVLPFATQSMYDSLGVAWACSLLGFCSLALAAIPFLFMVYGERLRAKSKFCQYLAQKEAEETERQRLEERGETGEA
jgi:multidrug resistance protein